MRIFAAAALLLSLAPARAQFAPEQQLLFFEQETEVDQLLMTLSREHRAEPWLIRNVQLFSPDRPDDNPECDVVIDAGRIEEIRCGEPIPQGRQRVLDGSGHWLMPGLVDMHVHNLVSSSQHLMNLAYGVTTVREMDGFPWLLEMRRQIRENRLLGPNMYVTGTILNAQPVGWFARVVTNPDEVRDAIADQASAGYDFIKIGNVLPLDLYRVVFVEARRHGLAVVGHIPHQITVREAAAQGQLTAEHFKEYLVDQTLLISEEDFVAATAHSSMWNTPTILTYRINMKGELAEKFIHEHGYELRYVNSVRRANWLNQAKQEPSENDLRSMGFRQTAAEIIGRLLPVTDRFLAGTDSGGYPFMTYGLALHDEIDLLVEAGLSRLQAIRSATTNAAEALEQSSEFGRILEGMRADLLLLSEHPLKHPAALRDPDWVFVRGIALARELRNGILESIAASYATEPQGDPRERTRKVIDRYLALDRDGFVLRPHLIEELLRLCRHYEVDGCDALTGS